MAANDTAKITIWQEPKRGWVVAITYGTAIALRKGLFEQGTTYAQTFPTNLPIQAALTKHLQECLFRKNLSRVYVVDHLADGSIETTFYGQDGVRRAAASGDRKLLLVNTVRPATVVDVEIVSNAPVRPKVKAKAKTAPPKASAPKAKAKTAPPVPKAAAPKAKTAPPVPKAKTPAPKATAPKAKNKTPAPKAGNGPHVSERGGRGMAHPGLHAGGEAYRVFVHELKVGGLDFATSRELWKIQPKKISPKAATEAARALLQARTKTNRVRPGHIKTPA